MKFKNYFSILFLLLYNVTCYSQYEVGEFSGESNVNEMGAATYSLPFDIPSGINGLQPSLGIVYNSQSGNGIAGMGTSLLGLSVISRTPKDIFHDGTAKGISYSTTDAYTKDGARLLLKSGSEGMSGSVYCTEGMPYNNITLMGSGQSQYFIAEQADGSKAYYGTNTIFPITDEPTAWYLDKVVDVYGNTITYNYTRHGSCVYISTIVYGTNETTATNFSATISFEYEGRIDTIKSAHRGITCNLSRRLKTVTIQTTQGTSSTTWYKYKFSYMYLDSFSRLDKITKSYENSDLPPITFTWSKLTGFSLGRTGLQNFGTLVAYNGTTNIDITGTDKVNQYFFTGNFLANEKEDIVLATFYNNYTYLNVYEYQSNGTFRLRANNDIAADSIDFRQLGNYVGDLDGDGYSEIIMPCTSTDSFKIYASTDIRWQNASGNAVYPAGSNYSRPLTKVFSEKITSFSPCTPIHTLGDFYNCGRSQIIYVETQLNPSMRYTCKLLMKNTDGTQSVSSFNMYVPNAPRRLIASDFNGDGLQDLLVLQRTGYQIYINQGSAAGTMPFVETAKVYGGDLCEVQNVLTGDFNGDGMLDFLTEAEHDDNWYFYFGNGNGTFTKKLACSLPNCTDKSYTERDNNKLQCYVTDFDNDGKQDVIMTKAFYEKKTQLFPKKEWGEYKETYTYWMKSTGYSLIQQKRTTTSNVNDALPAHFVAGDFDGDGFIEYIKYGGDILNATTTTSNWNFYKNSTLTPASNKITKISTPNHGTETIFSYASLADGNVYTKGANSQYPLLDVTLPIHVVKRTTLKAGGWTNTKDYTYSGLRIHLQGRGLLGFTTTSVYDQNSDTRITNTITSLDTDFYIPTGICSSTQTAETTSSCLTTISVNRRNSNNYFAYPSSIVNTDIYNNTTTTLNTYNTMYGYQTQQQTNYGSTNMYKRTSFSSYNRVGGVYKPQVVTEVQKHKDATNEYMVRTEYSYNTTKGYIQNAIEYANSIPNYHSYTYDNYGNLLTHNLWASGIDTITTTYTYDATHRFVSEKSSNISNIIEATTYNSLDLPTENSKKLNGSTIEYVRYAYDSIGRKASEQTYPQITTTNYTYGWGIEPTRRFFILSETTASPLVKTWYDNLGRSVSTETTGEKEIQIQKETFYDSLGNIASKKTTIGNTTSEITYNYDALGRLSSTLTNAGSLKQFTYGNHSTIIDDNGIQTEKLYDEWGNIKQTTDLNGSTVEYFYNSNGNADRILADGAEFLITYDAKGRQISLTDPDAGCTTYTYDALDRITTQIDNKGTITTNTYDNSGLLTSTTCGDIITTYSYDSRQRLISESTGSQTISYQYNTKNLISRKTITVDSSKNLVFRYYYNSQNQLYFMYYPDNTVERYYYDENGNMERVTFNGQDVWKLETYSGTQRRAQLNDSLFRIELRNRDGYLHYVNISHKSNTLNIISYNFDKQRNLLMSRNSMLTGRNTENFSYDSLGRLVRTYTPHNRQTSLVEYTTNGNIASKTGVGSYYYESSRPHAVTMVDNTDSIVPTIPQYVTYTPFNKVQTVTQGDYELAITYGPDQQRNKTTLSRNDTLLYTRYYADNYEEVHSGNNVYYYYYIHTPDGLTNVAEKKNSTITVYSAETDYLGSIASLYNRNGQKVFRAEYDAWGKQNVVTDSLARFQRGYCNHEHWREFDLIDMNGRMYDPIIARFLSPDPFVQAPEDLQNYNRYSYCLNNPLKYNDPSGEFWNLIIGAPVGGVINWATNGHEFSWKGLGYFGVGAVAGAIGAGIGTGVSSALAGGSFGAGFVGSASASTASSCFVSGVAIGGSSGFAGGFTTGFGNGLVGGQGFGNSLVAGLKDGLVSGTSGALIGGISSGWKAHRKGDNFFGEKTILEEKVLAETDLTLVKQNGPFDCGFAATESMTGINQSDLANYYSCYNNELVPVIDPKGNDLAKTLNAVSNESWSLRHISQSNIVEQLRQGNKVLVTYTIYDGYNSYGHGVAVKNIIQQKIRTRVGYETTKQIYTIMNPASGGYETLNPKSIEHAFSLLHF